jgi:bifunctional non-homologous end joining protein LigD
VTGPHATGTPADVPRLVPPMQPSTSSADPPTGADWRVEVAWTGHRCIAYVHPDGRVRLLSGAANSMTAAYPELAGPLRERCPPVGMVLDGTIVARGEEHAPRARLLKRRHSRHRPTEQEIAAVPVDFQVADLLFLGGHPTVDLPYRERRRLLEGLGLARAPVWTTPLFPATELDSLMRIAAAEGVDAFHARHMGARYRPGARSKFWLRVPVQRSSHVLVGGWTPTDPHRPDTVGTLLLGVPGADGRLRYVGRVGVSVEQRRQLDADLRGGARVGSPFAADLPAAVAAHAVWVDPVLVGRVEYVGWVAGQRLRLPRWRGLVPLAETGDRWAVPPAGEGGPEPAAPEPATAVAAAVPAGPPAAGPEPAPAPELERRRLEQHFVYNSLNTVASLIRTDPARARELLIGFADLSRVADGPAESTLGRELEAVRAYLDLERARFGPRLEVAVQVDDGLAGVPVDALGLLGLVRAAVQQDIEPHREGGLLALTARRTAEGCEVVVSTTAGTPARLVLPG